MDILNRRRNIQSAALLAILCLGALAACVREKPAPPPAPPPATDARERPAARDLAGKPRDAKGGVTPGALEAEGPPPPAPKRPPEKTPEKRRNS